MFTGIIEEAGTIAGIKRTKAGIRLNIASRLFNRGVAIGDSIAVNGCCLTVAEISKRKTGAALSFDLLEETWNRTNFKQSREGDSVNLERSLSPSSRMGGHFVTGHVDGTGVIHRFEPREADHWLEVQASPEILRYIILKGSIAIDGISLTVAKVTQRRFGVWIIPHTLKVTALRERKAGDTVNLETDMLGKYVEKFLIART